MSVWASDNEAMAMTEGEWLACSDPQAMLEFLRGKASDRKLRLFAVAYFHSEFYDVICTDTQTAWVAIEEVAERYADGSATRQELHSASGAAAAAPTYDDLAWHFTATYAAAAAAIDVHKAFVAATQSDYAARTAPHAALAISRDQSKRRSLLYELFGNPFRPVTINPAWLTSTVKQLAQSIYDERAFDRLPILADALEDAGCDNADILNHCRRPGEHVRGCWVLDVVLGKE
jgi:hypothetical protein